MLKVKPGRKATSNRFGWRVSADYKFMCEGDGPTEVPKEAEEEARQYAENGYLEIVEDTSSVKKKRQPKTPEAE